MNNHENKYWLMGLLVNVLFMASCSSNENNPVVGDWQLKAIESNCTLDNTTEEREVVQSGDLCCIRTTNTEMNDTFTLSTTNLFCQKLTFEDDGILTIVSENDSSRDTISFSYNFDNEIIEVCASSTTNCVDYIFNEDEVVLSVEVTTIIGETCDRVFRYRKQ